MHLKVLIILGPTLADAVFATPIIRALKVQLDEVQLHVLADLSYAFTLDDNPYVDNIHFSHSSVWKNYQRIKKENLDVVVDLRRDLKSKGLAFLLNKRSYTFRSIYQQRWLMVNLKINQLADVHFVDRMFDGLKALQIRPDDLGLDYFIPEKDKVPMAWLPDGFRQGYVAICIHAPYNTRKLPVSRLIELCDKINKPIILLGLNADAGAGEAVSDFFTTGDKGIMIYNACGKFNFNQMASVIKHAKVVFTYDNEFIPIASAFKKETFVIWGNTIAPFGRYPYRTKFTMLESSTLSCRPCSSRGFDKCPLGHFNCMTQIKFDFYLP